MFTNCIKEEVEFKPGEQEGEALFLLKAFDEGYLRRSSWNVEQKEL
jgi:hypothetical protein